MEFSLALFCSSIIAMRSHFMVSAADWTLSLNKAKSFLNLALVWNILYVFQIVSAASCFVASVKKGAYVACLNLKRLSSE